MSQVPQMICIDPAEAGGPDVLCAVERPIPQPGAGEVLIRVAAAGVNRPDILQRRGMYPPPPGAPTIPGLEVAGEIVGVGDGIDPGRIGQKICALVAGGGYAQYCTAPLVQCLPVPDGLSLIEAAALPETLFTVWSNVFDRGQAKAGETILIHGGTSGIGTMAIALCKLFGLTVIVTCGSEDKCAAARALGADHASNDCTCDFARAPNYASQFQSLLAGIDAGLRAAVPGVARAALDFDVVISTLSTEAPAASGRAFWETIIDQQRRLDATQSRPPG